MLRLLAIALLVASCGTTNAEPAPTVSAGADIVYVRDGEDIVRVSGTSVTRVAPAGTLSRDGTRVYVTEQAGPLTIVRTIDLASGSPIDEIQLKGTFAVPSAYGRGPGGLSPNGEWLVLAGPPGSARGFAIVATAKLKVAQTVTVPGNVEFDAIDDLRRSLYVVEHPVPTTQNYNVRLYDLIADKLAERPVVDLKILAPTPEQEARGIMTGSYLASVPGSAGWHFTLYVGRRGPFVHALSVRDRYASCVLDIPPTLEEPGMWTMGLPADKRSIFVANGALGRVSVIDPQSIAVRRSAQLTLPPPAVAGRSVDAPILFSADARTLYVVGSTGILAVDAASLALRGHFLADRPLSSIALSDDGRRLYAIDAETETIVRLDAVSGQKLGEFGGLTRPTALVRVAR